MFRKYFLWIILLGAVGLWVYRDLNPELACKEPLKYYVGSFDSRFGVAKTDFQSAVKEAENIWENASGRDLFVFDSNPPVRGEFFKYIGSYFIRDDISVNLVYDERQQLSEERRNLISDINETKESAESVKQQFLSLEEKYKQTNAEYLSLVTQYRARKASYSVVEAKRMEVNSLADQVNAMVRKYNSIVKDINTDVRAVNQTAGQEFEEGQYVSDQNGERISIYEFSSREALVRVLAHELGHALGLDHNDDPDSIMYYLNNSKKMVPTKADLSDLALICKGK